MGPDGPELAFRARAWQGGWVTRVDCAEVISAAPADGEGARSDQTVKAVLIAEKVEGFFLERLSADGERVRVTQHDTMDEAMQMAYAEYELSGWHGCPE